jgi:cytochrome c-type biogenesis protein
MTLEISGVGIAAAFTAGAVSFLSPCVLPLVPAYISYVAGQAIEPGTTGQIITLRERLRTFSLSLCFVLGFTTIFVALGAGANALTLLLAGYRYELNIFSGALVILFGLLTVGLWRPAWAQRELRWQGRPPGSGPVAAYLLGMAFAFGWTPCIGPILGAILAVAASSANTTGGVALLAVYSLGLGVPFILSALFLSGFVARLGKLRRTGRILQLVAGGVMIAMGIAMITGHLTDVAIWLLETFPVLGRIG